MSDLVKPWESGNLDAAYPFTGRSSTGLERLVADFYYVRTPPVDSQRVKLTFFSNNNTPGAWAAQVVLKTEDLVTVFDSTLGGTVFKAANFGPWSIFQWWRGINFVRMLIETAGAGDFLSVSPTDLYLLSRTIDTRPGRVDLFRALNLIPPISLLGTAGELVELEAGYNISLSTADQAPGTVPILDISGLTSPQPVDSPRNRIRLNIDAIPGAGQGVYPSCESAPWVSSINGVAPDQYGDLLFDADGCMYHDRPGVNTGGSSVTLDNTEGPTAEHPEQPASTVPNKLQIHQTCAACCDCEDYTAVYERLRGLWTDAVAAYNQLVAVKAAYEELKAEFEALPRCSKLTGKLRLLPHTGWTMGVQILVQNSMDCDVTGATLSALTVTASPGSTVDVVSGSAHVLSGGQERSDWPTPKTTPYVQGTIYAGRFVAFLCDLFPVTHSLGQTIRVQATLTTANAGSIVFDETATVLPPFSK